MEPEEADQSKVLSLQASSTQKDLRIFVVDGNGNPVSGQQFTFRIAKDGAQTQTYEDEDQDGMLYLTDLAAGEYAVSLNPVDGYAVPDTALSASVSESVSYTVLQDISFLVKTEDEVDPAVVSGKRKKMRTEQKQMSDWQTERLFSGLTFRNGIRRSTGRR